MLGVVVLIVCSVWVASEIALALLKRAGTDAERRDGGTLRLLNAVIYVSVGVGVYLAVRGFGHLTIPLAVRAAGLAGIVLGLALRWWAILILRRFFTVDVAIHDGHALIRRGPYRLIRHPAYAGSLLSFAGLTLFFSSWISALVILVPIAAAFLHRIAIEEKVLGAAFPAEYADYSRHTSRLVPLVY